MPSARQEFYSAPHLVGSFIRKCDCQYFIRTAVSLGDQICNPVNNGAGFSAACTCQYQKRAFHVFHGFALLPIQLG
jgi:hypothetical protein